MDTYSRIKEDVEHYMKKFKTIIGNKYVHDLTHALTISYTEEKPFYLNNRLAIHSLSYKITFDKYIAEIQQEIFRLLQVDPMLQNYSLQRTLQSLQQLKMGIQGYLYQLEYDMNIEYLKRIIEHPSPLAAIICREKLKYYKITGYLGLDRDLADAYIRFLESGIVSRYGERFLYDFDMIKAAKIGVSTDIFPTLPQFIQCVESFKRRLDSK